MKETKEKGIGNATAGNLPGAYVVRAFNSMGSGYFIRQSHRAGDPMAIRSRATTRMRSRWPPELARDAGFEAVAVPTCRAPGVRPGRANLRTAAHCQGIARALRPGEMTDADAGFLRRAGSRLVPCGCCDRIIDVTAAELPALGWCWLYIFSVLASYYILRPIRDQMGVAGGVNNLPWLFTGTLIVMLALNVPFSALVKPLPRRQFIPLTYRFFAVTILAFGAVLHWATPEQTIWVGRAFLIRTSVFNLFVVSIFWGSWWSTFSAPNRASGCSGSLPLARLSARSSDRG